MKALKLLILGVILFLGGAIQAQVSVNVHIGAPPPWGPVGFTEARYYYLPDVEAYYDVPSSMFIYNERGTWVHRTYLPRRFRNYDLYGGYKVVMNDYHGETPYSSFKEHRMKYRRGYHGDVQRTIGDRPGRGNSGIRNGRNDNHGDRGNDRNTRRGNDKNGKDNHGKRGGESRKR